MLLEDNFPAVESYARLCDFHHSPLVCAAQARLDALENPYM
jgi:hypothetical protein